MLRDRMRRLFVPLVHEGQNFKKLKKLQKAKGREPATLNDNKQTDRRVWSTGAASFLRGAMHPGIGWTRRIHLLEPSVLGGRRLHVKEQPSCDALNLLNGPCGHMTLIPPLSPFIAELPSHGQSLVLQGERGRETEKGRTGGLKEKERKWRTCILCHHHRSETHWKLARRRGAIPSAPTSKRGGFGEKIRTLKIQRSC